MYRFIITGLLCNHQIVEGQPNSLKNRLARAADLDEFPASEPASSSSAGPTEVGPRTLRRRIDLANGRTDACETHLEVVLRNDWGTGVMSSKKCHEVASGAEKQGATGLSGISKAGASGKHPQNIQRALFNCFGHLLGVPDFTYVRLPMREGPEFHPVLLPHKCFGYIFYIGKISGRMLSWDPTGHCFDSGMR